MNPDAETGEWTPPTEAAAETTQAGPTMSGPTMQAWSTSDAVEDYPETGATKVIRSWGTAWIVAGVVMVLSVLSVVVLLLGVGLPLLRQTRTTPPTQTTSTTNAAPVPTLTVAPAPPVAMPTVTVTQNAPPEPTTEAGGVYNLGCSRSGPAQPGKIVITCADGNDYVDNIQWTNGTGLGTEHYNLCEPNCADGRWATVTAVVTSYPGGGFQICRNDDAGLCQDVGHRR